MNATRSSKLLDRGAAFQRGVLLDAYLEADRLYWLRRATALKTAGPRPGDFTGQATNQDLAEYAGGVDRAAQACRSRASMTETARDDFAEAWNILEAEEDTDNVSHPMGH